MDKEEFKEFGALLKEIQELVYITLILDMEMDALRKKANHILNEAMNEFNEHEDIGFDSQDE